MLRVTLLFSMLICFLAFLISCEGSNADRDSNNASPGSIADDTDNAINFSDITYSRPDTVRLYAELSSTATLVRNAESDSSRIVEAVKSAEEAYNSYLTMYSYAELMYNKDCSNAFFKNEYDALSTAYPDIYIARERLAYDILCSEHKDELSKIGFSDSIPFKLDDPSRITNDYFSLLAKEEELKYTYQSLSEHNVYISYSGGADTYSSTLNYLKEALGENSQQFSEAADECHKLYLEALTERKLEIFIDLVNTRNAIASLLGYNNYNDYAYAVLGYGYTADEYQEYAEDVFEYMFPVYTDLSTKIFNPYFKNHSPKFLDKNTLIANLLSIYKSMDPKLYSVFGAMISAGLCDVARAETARNDSSYVVYFNNNRTPFLFHKSFGDARDYLAFSYGFGNYFDVFTNKIPNDSYYETELSSRMLEMITLSSLFKSLDSDESKYIYYLSMKNVTGDMVYGSILSLAERAIYDMNPDELNRESIALLLHDLAEEYSVHEPKISDIVRREVVLTPKALEAKSISLSYAARIYFDTSDTESKLQMYKALIDRASEKSPTSTLSGFGISSPFTNGVIMELSDKIFYSINGYHYYKNNSGDSVA